MADAEAAHPARADAPGGAAEPRGGAELARRFAETMLDELVHKEGVLKLTAKELHSFDSVAAFAALLRHTRKVFALLTPELLTP